MRIAALSLVLVAGAFAAAESATGPDLVRRREYFHLLRPGVAMAEIAADLGPPDSVTEGTTTYRLDVGRVDLTEQDGLLASADHRDPGQGTEASSLYHAAAGALRPSATFQFQEAAELSTSPGRIHCPSFNNGESTVHQRVAATRSQAELVEDLAQ